MQPSANDNGAFQVRVNDLVDEERPIELALSEADFGSAKSFRFPISPTISLDGNNELAIRGINSEELSGVVVEQWSRGNYSLVIEGTFVHDEDRAYVEAIDGEMRAAGSKSAHDYVSELTELLTAKRALHILAPETDRVGIFTIAIQSWSFPRRAGQGYRAQKFSIRAISLGVAQDLFVTTAMQPAFQSPTTGTNDGGVLA